MSAGADELVLFADNDHDLYRQSYLPIVENLKKKLAKGKYDPHLAAKLWRYHADRAAQKYAKGYDTPWHKMFSTKDRQEAANHWEQYARREYLGVTSHDASRARARRPPARRKAPASRARRAPARRSPSKKESPEQYAKRRVEETGRPYFVTGMGHVLLNDPHNRKGAKDLGGIAKTFSPTRRAPARDGVRLDRYPRVYLLKGAAWKTSMFQKGYYHVIGQTTKAGMMLQDEARPSRSGELAYALAKSPRSGAVWFLARNTRPVKGRR